MTCHTPIAPITPAADTPAADTSGGRHDGWTPERQRAFLEAIADGATVESACRLVGLSAASAYNLRRRANGAAFALGWRGANLLARDRLADRLLRRAVEGHVVTTTRASGEVVEQHRFDHALASRLLARLDRQTEESAPAHAAAQAVAGEFDQFLDLVEQGDGPARAGLFLVARTPADAPTDLEPVRALARADLYTRAQVGTPGEVDTADLDPAHRADWTAGQWARAEAAGLVRLAPPPAETRPAKPASGPQLPQLPELGFDDPAEEPVWWDDVAEEWRTRFPPPEGFDGEEEGDWGDDDYARALTDAEQTVVDAVLIAREANCRAEEERWRDRWFARARRALEAGRADSNGDAEPFDEAGRCPADYPTLEHPMAATDHDVTTLNSLIAATLDSVNGYTEAAKDAESTRFGAMFTTRARDRRQVAQALQSQVTRLGGNPEDDGTLLAGAHRAFLNLKSAVTGQDDKAVIDEVERGEDHIKAKFEDALADTDLSPATRTVIEDAFTSVRQGHDQMRDLKHSMEG